MKDDLIERLGERVKNSRDRIPDTCKLIDEAMTALREQEGIIKQQGVCTDFQMNRLKVCDKRIAELERENLNLQEQIEKWQLQISQILTFAKARAGDDE
jgi:hypothetical protein